MAATKRKTHSQAKARSNRKTRSRPLLRQAVDGAPGGKSTSRASAPPTVTKGLHTRERDLTVVRPSWRRYLQVYETLLHEGAPVTESAIAKVLEISRMSLWRIHRRNSGLRPWVSAQLAATNVHLIAPVIHMLGTMAVRTKSPKHAELFLRAVDALGPANGAPRDDEEESPDDSRYVTHVNVLVPHPQLPNGGPMPVFGKAPTSSTAPPLLPNGQRVSELGSSPSAKMPNLQDIPTVAMKPPTR